MILIEEIKENIADADYKNLNVELVKISNDDLQKTHRRITSNAGSELAISLPVGSCLKDGDILYRDSHKLIYVYLEEEKAIHIMPSSGIEWAKAAYNIGNIHHTVFLKEDGVYTPYDESVMHVIEKTDIPFEVIKCKLDGVRANIQGGEHSHSHKHEHNHEQTR